MTDDILQQKSQLLALLNLMEQVKVVDLTPHYLDSRENCQRLEEALQEKIARLSLQQNYSSQLFCPELRRLQITSVQKLTQEVLLLEAEISEAKQAQNLLQQEVACSYQKSSAYRDAAIPVARALGERLAERQDQRLNTLHYQRMFNRHG
ncbi:hypothetical protein [Rheinheimera aquimaris]|jgi:phosphoenolpyruvate carboxylase|uniref:hypothetical protein n=1 Tax=Rheinheimera aquimaris TaxID=412437 RepID=UPI001E5ED494|nr:hypothetical protein [Rheinheimera aquimaris]MCD1600353.1 hypothetical protein [Rheinheimera aquimaris]